MSNLADLITSESTVLQRLLALDAGDSSPTGTSSHPLVSSRTALVRDAVKESLSSEAHEPVHTTALVNAMFRQYFLQTLEPTFSHPLTLQADPLLDGLVQFCEHSLDPHSIVDSNVLAITSAAFDTISGMVSEDIKPFQDSLIMAWLVGKDVKLETKWSPMPWSTTSREERSSPHTSPLATMSITACYHHSHAYVILALAAAQRHSPFIHFPPMKWLGARHDGYPVSTSLSAYVQARYDTVESSLEHCALWQSALSFGLLEAITGLPIPESFLLSREGPDVFLTCGPISSVLHFWYALTCLKSPPARFTWAQEAMKIVTCASNAVDEASKQARFGIFGGTGLVLDEIESIICSIKTLSYTLSTVLGLWFSEQFPKDNTYSATYKHDLAGLALHISQEVYMRNMVEDGWCPATVRNKKFQSLLSLAYANTQTPYIRFSREEHLSCTRKGCVAHNIDEATYRTLHTTPSCACKHLGPSLPLIADILRLGGIPVVSFDGNTLAVRRASEGPYVALSHVWADGLGSTTEEGLPTCQVMRIATYAYTLVPGGAFWADSLCVPRERTLRKQAILRMAQTYRDAAAVLVFDAGIRALCSTRDNHARIILAVSFSLWMQRVWTLQEMLLARELHFELSDGLLHTRSIADAVFNLPDHGLMIATGVLCYGNGALQLFSEVQPVYAIDEILPLIQGRRTSKPEDETLAIAGLVGIDVGVLLSTADVEARMKAFLLAVRKLPLCMAYVEVESPRLRIPGFRWAPSSLSEIGADVPRKGDAVCTIEGLTTDDETAVLTFPSVIIDRERDGHAIYIKVKPSFNQWREEGALAIYVGITPAPDDSPVSCNALLVPMWLYQTLRHNISHGLYIDSRGRDAYQAFACVYIKGGQGSFLESGRQTKPPIVCEWRGIGRTDMPCTESYVHSTRGPVVEGRFSSSRVTVT